MVITFTPEKETHKIKFCCVRYSNDLLGKQVVIHFGLKQKQTLLSWLSRKLKDVHVTHITIDIEEKEI